MGRGVWLVDTFKNQLTAMAETAEGSVKMEVRIAREPSMCRWLK